MKKIFYLLLLIFGISHAGTPQSKSEQAIEIQIKKARELGASNPEKALEILLKCNVSSKEINYKKGILDSDNSIMILYFWKGDYKKVIELSNETVKFAKELNNAEVLSDTYRLKAVSYLSLGTNYSALEELNKALEYARKISNEDSRFIQISTIYDNTAQYYENINSIKEVILYKTKSLEEAKKINENGSLVNQKYQMIAFQYMNLGTIYSEMREKEKAEQYFFESLKIYESKKYPFLPKSDEIILLSEMGKFYYSQKKYTKAIEYLERGKEAEKSISVPYTRKEIYEILFKSYLELNNTKLSKKYSDLYTSLNDSIIKSERKAANAPVKQILSEEKQKHDNNIHQILWIAGSILSALMISGWLIHKKNQKILHKKYESIILKLKNKDSSPVLDQIHMVSPEEIYTKDSSEKVKGITNDTLNTLLLKLQRFENSQKFLKKDMNLPTLAVLLNTNTRYLSEVIKQHKGKNFNNYLNGLRIHHITNMLYEKPVYREYKISHLADYCGFSSREVFAIIFKKETGVTPSYFISQLKNEHSE